MGFSRQGYWSGLPLPSPGDLPNPGIETRSPTVQADTLLSEPLGKCPIHWIKSIYSFWERVDSTTTNRKAIGQCPASSSFQSLPRTKPGNLRRGLYCGHHIRQTQSRGEFLDKIGHVRSSMEGETCRHACPGPIHGGHIQTASGNLRTLGLAPPPLGTSWHASRQRGPDTAGEMRGERTQKDCSGERRS